MNNFFKGLLFGIGIGLLFAPRKGEETRQLIAERIGEIRGQLPESEQINQYTQLVGDRVSHTADSLKGYAQQAASTVKSTANNLSSIAQQAASNVKQTGQDVADKTSDTAKSFTNNQ